VVRLIVPRKYTNIRFEKDDKELRVVKDVARAFGDGAWIYGPPGCRKTTIMVHACAEFIAHKVSPSVEPAEAAKNFVFTNLYYMNFILSRDDLPSIMRVKYLMLDDLLSSQRFTDYQLDMLRAIIAYRYDHNLPLIVTSTKKPSEIQELLGKQITNKLGDVCQALFRLAK